MGGPGGVCTGLLGCAGWLLLGLLLGPDPPQAESTSSKRSTHETQVTSTAFRFRAGILRRFLAVLIYISSPFSPVFRFSTPLFNLERWRHPGSDYSIA